MASETWIDAGDAQALRANGRMWARVEGLQLAVFQQGDEVHALEDSCPHAGASLCTGRVEAGHVQCPAHGLKFNLATGRLQGAAADSPAALAVRTFAVRIRESRVEILPAQCSR